MLLSSCHEVLQQQLCVVAWSGCMKLCRNLSMPRLCI